MLFGGGLVYRLATGRPLNLSRPADAIFYEDGARLRSALGLGRLGSGLLVVALTPKVLAIRLSPPLNLCDWVPGLPNFEIPLGELEVLWAESGLTGSWIKIRSAHQGHPTTIEFTVRHSEDLMAALRAQGVSGPS